MEIIDLKKFDENLKKISEEIKSEVDKINLDKIPSYEFKLSEYESSQIKNCQGIYIFYIQKKSLDKFEIKWGNNIKKATPKIIKNRIKDHTNTIDWIPLYIGKSEKVISRIAQHITLKKESTTSSMKLRAREKFNEDIFAVRIIPLKTEHYSFIAHYIESELRKTINPIVGKK